MEIWESDLTPGLTFSVELVTPELAAHWLTKVKVDGDVRVQRNPINKRVDRYTADMENSQWPFLGDPVRFSADDYFIDGQHRAKAIVDSGVAQPLLVIRGFPFELMQHFDIGAKRTFVNYLQMHGVKNPGAIGGILAALWYWETGKFGTKGLARVREAEGLNTEPTHAELWTLFCQEPTVHQAVLTAAQFYRTTNNHSIKMSQLGLFHILATRIDPYRRDAFFAELSRTEAPLDITPGYPITVFCDRVRRQGATEIGRAKAVPRFAWLAYLIKTWNAWSEGERLFPGALIVPTPRWNTLPKINGLVDGISDDSDDIADDEDDD